MKEGLHLGAGIFVPIDEVEIRPSRAATERRLNAKRRQAERKQERRRPEW